MAQIKSSKGQMNSSSGFGKNAPEALARDDLRTAFSGDQNRGPVKNKKKRPYTEHVKARRLPADSDKIPIR